MYFLPRSPSAIFDLSLWSLRRESTLTDTSLTTSPTFHFSTFRKAYSSTWFLVGPHGAVVSSTPEFNTRQNRRQPVTFRLLAFLSLFLGLCSLFFVLCSLFSVLCSLFFCFLLFFCIGMSESYFVTSDAIPSFSQCYFSCTMVRIHVSTLVPPK